MATKKKQANIVAARRRKILGRQMFVFFRWLLIIIFFIGAVWGLNYFYNSSYFKIKDIQVVGNSYYTDDEVTGLIPHIFETNIFEVNKKKVEDRLAGELVWLKEVALNKIFPDNIIIEIEERKPYFKIEYKNDIFIMDDEGLVLEKIKPGDNEKYEDLLLVKNVAGQNIGIGEKIAKKNALSSAEIYRTMDAQVKELIKEARLDDNIYGDIIFITFGNKEIIFGNSEEIVKKIEVLKQLLKEESNYTIIDLRSPESPIVK